MENFILPFRQISRTDLGKVGGKNASLGEMIRSLTNVNIRIPDGFATTAAAFRYFLSTNGLEEPISALLEKLERPSYSNLVETGAAIRELFHSAKMPRDLADQIRSAYSELVGEGAREVAVRSSATAEDLPEASFAGQHESYLHISGENAVVEAVQNCFASMYTDRAIKYREYNSFPHSQVALSAGVQKMVHADLASSGVAFTLEPESGFRDLIHLSGVWGLGENIVQGIVNPDEFLLFKPTLRQGKNAILQRRMGDKEWMMVYEKNAEGVTSTTNRKTPSDLRRKFVLTNEEINELGNWCLNIEDLYGRPMDIEWAKDGNDGLLYILQARPETVQSRKNNALITEYTIGKKGTRLGSGQAVGSAVATGKVRLLDSPAQSDKLAAGEILVTNLTSPDWDPILKKAAAIITNKGGRTSHASIVARELGVPAVVGCGNITDALKDGQEITVSCCEGKTGFIYDGILPVSAKEIDCSTFSLPERTEVMLIVGDPEKAFSLSFYPNNGVGLMRMEFIITHSVKIHPMALLQFDKVKDETVKQVITNLTCGYTDKPAYFIDKLAEGIATIAAAFYPRPVILRMSDFKTNEYAGLLGGTAFEPLEENPMLGFRGASRYYHPMYRDGFRLECLAVKKVREEMGLINTKVMIPFCRTVEEGKKVLQVMKEDGLDRQADPSLEIYMMAEIPSNVLMAESFAELFDGFSIGSNDLTQLTLGIDRDSAIISDLFSELNPAPMAMIADMIRRGRKAGRPVGLCGQAPSDYPEFAQFLVEEGISSISFNPDAVLKGIENILAAEKLHPSGATRRVAPDG
ncbi:phosphoenolpyruvate synthase [Flavihumibacter stibioxidans]|uniref:Phosphoenolpyruvate synthase n=1 Tax=Flavihumibacter stibioxidans TaxID=1834163 RepID=A0ABR7M3Z6_9BACT|nr:phosphoenolpyruvate synthase [Flavihumibacter stibioxidans]MBC6489692.1 phosphoenolpyruvate synthase [Flavihumibacter stibioxidans]